MRVVFLGTPDCGCPYLPAIEASGGEIVAVVTQPDKPRGRGRELCPPPVKSAALDRGLCLMQPLSCRDQELIQSLRDLSPDILLVVAYGQILCPELLSAPRVAAVNVHYSLLPALRGAAPVQHALLAGLAETGVTLQHLAAELDAGDVIGQKRVAIQPEDDVIALTARLTEAGCQLVTELLPRIMDGSAPRTLQDVSGVTWAPRIAKADGALQWSQPAAAIVNRVRAMNPWPGAFCHVGDRVLTVLQARELADTPAAGAPPGTIVATPRDAGPQVATGDGMVELVTVKLPGKRALGGAEYLRGARLQPGDRLLDG